jgi:hypothetical protein
VTGKKEHTQQWHKPCITIGTCKTTVIAFEIVYTDFILMNSHIRYPMFLWCETFERYFSYPTFVMRNIRFEWYFSDRKKRTHTTMTQTVYHYRNLQKHGDCLWNSIYWFHFNEFSYKISNVFMMWNLRKIF